MTIGADLWELSIITSFFVIVVLITNNIYKKYRYAKISKNKEEKSENQLDIELSRDPANAPYGDEN